eukprot:TRINITY_DN7077_c0_g2_i2.p1 TRINITY_DN7077_c0_g2~~TRINITY_DN7077_c0_g2_i2.p1  ORF type:complete len:330 (+),score=66.89 TRINITY_DN7077_c0_g2_i2:1052-2041(+)
MFPKAYCATSDTVKRARTYLDERFGSSWDLAKAGSPPLLSTLKKVYELDVVSEDLPRNIFLISKAQISQSFPIFEMVFNLSNDFVIFPFGLDHTANGYLLDGLAKLTGGQSEFVYLVESGTRLQETQEKVSAQLARILQPTLDMSPAVVEWGDLTPHMLLQSPSEVQHFYRGDLFLICATTSGVPKGKETEICLTGSARYIPSFKISIPLNTKTDYKKEGDKAHYFQLKIEQDFPDGGAVRLKKVWKAMTDRGALSAGTCFCTSTKIGECHVTLLSSSDFLHWEEESAKKTIKYTPAQMLQLQAFNMSKPSVHLGEIEKGFPFRSRTLR